jgi:hypothetical protein
VLAGLCECPDAWATVEIRLASEALTHWLLVTSVRRWDGTTEEGTEKRAEKSYVFALGLRLRGLAH